MWKNAGNTFQNALPPQPIFKKGFKHAKTAF